MGSIHAIPRCLPAACRAGTRALPRGFTLVELLITMAVAGILLAIAVPSLQRFLADQAAGASADELAEGLRLARTEATKRGLNVKVCASSNTTDANPTCTGQGDDTWLNGWIMIDANNNVLRVQNAMRSISTVDSGGDSEVQFYANGLAVGAVTFTLTPPGDAGTQRVRTVAVNQQGRVKVTKGGAS